MFDLAEDATSTWNMRRADETDDSDDSDARRRASKKKRTTQVGCSFVSLSTVTDRDPRVTDVTKAKGLPGTGLVRIMTS